MSLPILAATSPQTILGFDGSGFDATRVYEPTVAIANGIYELFFAGLPFANNVQIGLATSSDGFDFTKLSDAPVISNAGSPIWADFREIPVSVIYNAGTYMLWFNADNSNLTSDPGFGSGFGLATSTDGVNWNFSAADPVRFAFNVPTGTGIDLQEVVKLGSSYDAYYVYDSPTGSQLFVASSGDGATFSNDAAINLPNGDQLTAATTIQLDGTPTVLAVLQDTSGVSYLATSTDAQTFTIAAQTTLPTSFSVNDIAVQGDTIQFFGSEGVGNVNWDFGNTVIKEASASLSSIFNQSPVAQPDYGSLQQKHVPLVVDAAHGVLANDSDPDGDALTVAAINGSTTAVGHLVAGSYGSLTLNADGRYIYTANNGLASNQAYVDTFSYTVSDGHGNTASSTLSVAIEPASSPKFGPFPAVDGSLAADLQQALHVMSQSGSDYVKMTDDQHLVMQVVSDVASQFGTPLADFYLEPSGYLNKLGEADSKQCVALVVALDTQIKYPTFDWSIGANSQLVVDGHASSNPIFNNGIPVPIATFDLGYDNSVGGLGLYVGDDPKKAALAGQEHAAIFLGYTTLNGQAGFLMLDQQPTGDHPAEIRFEPFLSPPDAHFAIQAAYHDFFFG